MEIEIQNLSCGYRGKAIVEDISFRIGERQTWCVLGANGIGKTTFFKTVLNLLKPVSGQILLDGVPLERWNRKELAKQIAYVPQSHVPPFPFLVEEVVAMGRNPYQRGLAPASARDRAAVDEAMEALGIGYLRGKRYTQISGGERQLTLLARAIAQETPVLVLDEPVANLDFGNQARVIGRVCDLVSRWNRTIIMTTHNPDHAFLPDANVLLLFRGGGHRVGRGRDIVTPESIRELYQIDNRVVDLPDCQKTVCVPLYSPGQEPPAAACDVEKQPSC